MQIAAAKCDLTFVEALTRGVYCNALVCLAVWLCLSCRTTGDRVPAILFPITAFVAAGFEHCVANMYFIPIGLLIKAGAPDAFWTAAAPEPAQHAQLTWLNFLWVNVLPVTIGNIIGGSVFVGLVYWLVYGRVPHRDTNRVDAGGIRKPAAKPCLSDGGAAERRRIEQRSHTG